MHRLLFVSCFIPSLLMTSRGFEVTGEGEKFAVSGEKDSKLEVRGGHSTRLGSGLK